MDLGERLLKELKDFRPGWGLREPEQLRGTALHEHLADDVVEAFNRLKRHVETVGKLEHRRAAALALGFTKQRKNREDRLKDAARAIGVRSKRQVYRHEDAGFEKLVQIIIRESPRLSDEQKHDQMTTAAYEKRIADLEAVVSFLGRALVLTQINDGIYEEIMDKSIVIDRDESTGRIIDIVMRATPAGKEAVVEMEKIDNEPIRTPRDATLEDFNWVDDGPLKELDLLHAPIVSDTPEGSEIGMPKGEDNAPPVDTD